MKRYLILVLLVVMATASRAQAQKSPTPTPSRVPTPAPTPIQRVFLYSVKFVCGFEPPPTGIHFPQEPPVKPGNYTTAVNVHNFSPSSICLAKKAVLAFPESSGQQLIGRFQPFKLPSDGAFEIDCSDIVSLLRVPPSSLPSFIKGFVELQSRTQLNVQAVYTACNPSAPGQAGCASGIALEVVPEPSFNSPSTTPPGICPVGGP